MTYKNFCDESDFVELDSVRKDTIVIVDSPQQIEVEL